MKGFMKFHKVVTIIQLLIISLSLCIASLGLMIEHPFITYFWYLALLGIAMMMTTSFLIGVCLVMSRVFMPHASKHGKRWFSRSNRIRV